MSHFIIKGKEGPGYNGPGGILDIVLRESKIQYGGVANNVGNDGKMVFISNWLNGRMWL